jgi:hypothetical protein
VDQVLLVRSQVGGRAPIYTVCARFDLDPACTLPG